MTDSNNNKNLPVAASPTSVVPTEVIEETALGQYIKKSRICAICLRDDHMEINSMRGAQHATYKEIETATGISTDTIELHFRNHFIISKTSQQVINLKENTSTESNEIVRQILEGDIDFFAGAVGVLESKAQRLHGIKDKLDGLSDKMEINDAEDVEKQEYILLNKLAQDIENSIVNVYKVIYKDIFPAGKDDMLNGVLSFKQSILSKFVDDIIRVLLEFEKLPEYTDLIKQIRIALSQRITALEATIIESGGDVTGGPDQFKK